MGIGPRTRLLAGVLAYLSRHRSSSAEEVAAALGVRVRVARTWINQLRATLGSDAMSGELHLRLAPSQKETCQMGERVLVDLDLFERLVGGEGLATVSIARLTTALGLVEGRPFSTVSAHSRGWEWLATDQVDQRVAALVADAATAVRERLGREP